MSSLIRFYYDVYCNKLPQNVDRKQANLFTVIKF